MGALLDKAGGSRFLGHSRFYHRLLGEEEPHQVLHAALMEALGYSQNRAPFLELAYLAPYEHLMEVAAGSRREGRAGALGQALLHAAGLGPRGDGVAPGRGPPGPGSQGGPGGQVPLSWNLFRVRPANHPRRRIDGYARMLERFLPLGGWEPRGGEGGAGVMGTSPCPATRSLGAALGVEARWRYKGLVDGLTGLVSWAWGPGGVEFPWRFLEGSLAVAGAELEGSTARGKPAPIGRERARDMAVNCVLPFVHAWAGPGQGGPGYGPPMPQGLFRRSGPPGQPGHPGDGWGAVLPPGATLGNAGRPGGALLGRRPEGRPQAAGIATPGGACGVPWSVPSAGGPGAPMTQVPSRRPSESPAGLPSVAHHPTAGSLVRSNRRCYNLLKWGFV